ncbi:unnamed protein product [Brassica oleracea]
MLRLCNGCFKALILLILSFAPLLLPRPFRASRL